ncbi:COX5B-domain-containing protein [Rickenella mellea]|uniref:Cytochrome c oxidase subunit 4, mitochondrial n=1 Tax=Rickenella mellea TaxID=50990 RepID=A0A4Y7PPQ3_9AGAM|nr:COX5B-domain-containing protein [Rickenella mellea]
MYRALRVVRTALPPRTVNSVTKPALRAFSASPRSLAGDHGHDAAPQLYGPGLKDPAGVPSDEDQATGLERLQLLGKMEGVDVFDMSPLDASRLGTMKDPIAVPSLFDERIVGCTGSPADSHDVIWIVCEASKRNNRHRCPECGSVYTINNLAKHDGQEVHHH